MLKWRRRLVWLWIGIGVVVWNGVFDLVVRRGMTEYLFRQAAFDAGRGERYTMHDVMDLAIRHATLIASAWAIAITAAGVATVMILARIQHSESRIPKGSA